MYLSYFDFSFSFIALHEHQTSKKWLMLRLQCYSVYFQPSIPMCRYRLGINFEYFVMGFTQYCNLYTNYRMHQRHKNKIWTRTRAPQMSNWKKGACSVALSFLGAAPAKLKGKHYFQSQYAGFSCKFGRCHFWKQEQNGATKWALRIWGSTRWAVRKIIIIFKYEVSYKTNFQVVEIIGEKGQVWLELNPLWMMTNPVVKQCTKLLSHSDIYKVQVAVHIIAIFHIIGVAHNTCK